MSRPDFENIDKWFFEFTEGNLTDEQESNLFDFLEQNPEFMPDLKAWTNAKIKAPEQTEFSSKHLIKPVPFLLRPYTMVSLGFLAIILGWFSYNSVPVTPLYSETSIDSEIVYIEENDFEIEQADLYIEQLLASSNNKKQAISYAENNILRGSKKHSLSPKTNSITNSNSTFNSNVNKTESIASTDGEAQKSKPIEADEYSRFIAENEINFEGDLNSKEANRNIKSSQFEIVSNYLKNKYTERPIDMGEGHEDQNLANNRTNKSIKSKSANSSFKKKINSSLRKIKRMADYPVAMQNTKNPNFHTPMMTGYNANIAMVGTATGKRIQATSRMQWPNESNSQIMNTLSYDGYVYALRGGVGVDVNYNNYQNNDLSNYSAGFTYSPKLSINKKISFEPAIRLKMGVVSLDEESNIIGDNIELDRSNTIPFFKNEEKANGSELWYRDVGLGFMLNTEWFFVGFNADNIGRHYNNFYSSDLDKEYKSNIHYTAVMGTEYVAKTRQMRLSGYALFQNYGDLNELWLGSNFQYSCVQIGIGLSTNADMAASLGMVFKQFSLHYNIDYTESRLLAQQNLSHQITMKFLLKPSRNAAKYLKL